MDSRFILTCRICLCSVRSVVENTNEKPVSINISSTNVEDRGNSLVTSARHASRKISVYIGIFVKITIYVDRRRDSKFALQLKTGILKMPVGIFENFLSEIHGWNVRGYLHNYGSTENAEAEGSVQAVGSMEIADFKPLDNKSITVEPSYKRHVCSYCKKVYLLKNLLKRHMQYSCEMIPKSAQFACTFCPYKSMYKANMERHVRNVHDAGAMKFHCELCNFRSNYTFCVRRHMKTFHNVSSDEKQ
ncbi:uncharacterized protein LOC112493828 isoform X2 [Cephus cinctus]|nr:uncharacterized protein LOC112493828 isoform X2 [Cephus cinctus]